MNEIKEKGMDSLKKECLKFCYSHPLYEEGAHPVFGEGSLWAKIMLVGEAPGYYESLSGRPFCGAAGKVLDELLDSAGIKREKIYITNVVKIRPPNNRDPKPEEIQAFAPYLEKQIEIIKPKVICPLGRYSMRFLMEKFGLKDKIQAISKIHGKVFEVKNLFNSVKIIPLYHPAVATYNPKMKEILKKDFQILGKFK
ncbi:uracil-DNA glycosylase [Patescibacteria group bacterium]|nr:uracil-DNA glycosylase [Patescibacteria group bacterium]